MMDYRNMFISPAKDPCHRRDRNAGSSLRQPSISGADVVISGRDRKKADEVEEVTAFTAGNSIL